jgi:hypothetical protein
MPNVKKEFESCKSACEGWMWLAKGFFFFQDTISLCRVVFCGCCISFSVVPIVTLLGYSVLCYFYVLYELM